MGFCAGPGNTVIVKFTQETVDTYNILCTCLVCVVEEVALD